MAAIVTGIITPGTCKIEVEYDTAGRITTVRDGDGHTTNLRYSPRGRLLAVTRGRIMHSTLYDGWGRAVELGDSDGKRYQALAILCHDDAGRDIWTTVALFVAVPMAVGKR